MLSLIDLIVAARGEVGIGSGVRGAYRFAEVSIGRLVIVIGIMDGGMNIEQLANLLADGFVEVEELVPALFEERAQVVLIIHEEGRVAVGRPQGIPMEVAPVAVVADVKVTDSRFLVSRRTLYGNGQCLHTLCGCDDTAVAVGLFLERLMTLYPHLVGTVEFLVPLDGSEVGGGKEYVHRGRSSRLPS